MGGLGEGLYHELQMLHNYIELTGYHALLIIDPLVEGGIIYPLVLWWRGGGKVSIMLSDL